jgi:hypothetical protein
MMNQLKRDINTGNKVVMVTARSDFDDKELFLDTFRKFGVDIDRVHVYRAGNNKQGSTEERKKQIIKTLLDKDDYNKAIMYDDAKPNLHTFIELKKDHPKTRFYAWHVSPKGDAAEYMREGVVSEKKKRKKSRWAAYGPGPYGGYGYAVGYSGDGGGDSGGGVGEVHKPNSKAVLGTDKRFGSGAQRIQWLETPLDSDTFGIRGFKVEFKKDGVYISKNGKVVWSKAGDYSNPMNKHMSGVKKIITGLERQEKPFPGEYQQFGKRPPEELQSRKEWKDKRDKWMQKVYDYAERHNMSPTEVMFRDLVKFEESKNNQFEKEQKGREVNENFADGKKPGRKGLAKRSGVNTKASVSSLRKTAKNSSGEKQRMAHWLANMKAGRAKKNK